MNRDLNLRVGEGRVMVACHRDWKLEGMNQTLLSQAGMEDKSWHLALKVQQTTEAKARQVAPAIQEGVEGHNMPLVLVRWEDLEGKETNLVGTSQVVSQDKVEEKVMDVSQEVMEMDMVIVSRAPVASLPLREDVTLGHSANHRAAEAKKEDQVSPRAVDNTGLGKVSLLVMVSEELVPVNNP